MRKNLITPTRQSDQHSDREWLVLDEVASVEVTSEAEGYPVEGALSGHGERGWRAGAPDTQIIRLLFDTPQTIRFIRLVFRKSSLPALRSSGCDGFPLMGPTGGMSSGINGISARHILYWNAKDSLQQWQICVEQGTNP